MLDAVRKAERRQSLRKFSSSSLPLVATAGSQRRSADKETEGCATASEFRPEGRDRKRRGREGARKEVARMTKILLVDDSKFLRLATERALARAGYEVSSAIDGANALEMAREKKPDLILLDMLLPKMTGPDVWKALKHDPATAGNRSRGIHGTVAKERGAPGKGRSLRIPGQSGVGTGQGERGVAAGAGPDRATVEAGSSGGKTGTVESEFLAQALAGLSVVRY